MICSVCGEKMEAENEEMNRNIIFLKNGKLENKNIPIPAVIYQCPTCGTVKRWDKENGITYTSEAACEALNFEELQF